MLRRNIKLGFTGGFCKIESNQEILDYIVNRLKKDKWSPDVIAAKIYEDTGFTISAETIYNFIYNSAKAKSFELYKYLPSRRYTRLKQGSRKRKYTIPGRISIHQREEVASDKTLLGHFEADLTINNGNRSTNIAVKS